MYPKCKNLVIFKCPTAQLVISGQVRKNILIRILVHTKCVKKSARSQQYLFAALFSLQGTANV